MVPHIAPLLALRMPHQHQPPAGDAGRAGWGAEEGQGRGQRGLRRAAAAGGGGSDWAGRRIARRCSHGITAQRSACAGIWAPSSDPPWNPAARSWASAAPAQRSPDVLIACCSAAQPQAPLPRCWRPGGCCWQAGKAAAEHGGGCCDAALRRSARGRPASYSQAATERSGRSGAAARHSSRRPIDLGCSALVPECVT